MPQPLITAGQQLMPQGQPAAAIPPPVPGFNNPPPMSQAPVPGTNPALSQLKGMMGKPKPNPAHFALHNAAPGGPTALGAKGGVGQV